MGGAFDPDNLHRLPVSQPRPERHTPAIDLGTNAAIADTCMNCIGKINRRRAARQADHLAFRGEAENLVMEHVELDLFQKFLRCIAIFHPVHQLGKPVERINGKGVLAPPSALIGPMGGDAGFRHLMHLPRADLHFHPAGTAAENRGVKTAIAI